MLRTLLYCQFFLHYFHFTVLEDSYHVLCCFLPACKRTCHDGCRDELNWWSDFQVVSEGKPIVSILKSSRYFIIMFRSGNQNGIGVLYFLPDLDYLGRKPTLHHGIHIEQRECADINHLYLQLWVVDLQTGSNQARVGGIFFQRPRDGNDFEDHARTNDTIYIIIQQIQSINKFKAEMQLSQRSFRSTVKSKISSAHMKRPTSYRVLMKSRSGFLEQFNDNNSISLNRTKNRTLESENQEHDIKQYVKDMKNRQSQGSILSAKVESRKNVQSIFQKQLQQQRTQLVSMRHTPSEIQQQRAFNLSMDQIEKRVDYLLQLKLLKTKDIRKIQKNQIDEINKQISKYVEILQNYDDYFINELGKSEQLQIANRKIMILQKIMAESATESQMAKKHFYGMKTNRKQRKPVAYKMDIKTLKQMTKNFMDRSMPASLHFESTNKSNFKAPDKKDYPLKQHKPTYEFNNQPMPRSSYGRDYLVYGNLPKFTYKQESSNLMPSSSVGNRSSSYQSDFTSKKIERINFKQLDCYQDKFKNLKVSFMEAKNKTIYENSNPINDGKNLGPVQEAPIKLNKHARHKTQHCHYIPNLSTESRVNFTGENNKIRSSIKHKNLTDLKYAFKASINA